MQIALSANPHYLAIGGEAGVRRLVERCYALMDELPQANAIRAMHPADLGQAKERLFMFLTGWLGGPPLYAERYGQPLERIPAATLSGRGRGRSESPPCRRRAAPRPHPAGV